MTTTETPLHIRQADGLRALADMIEQNPEVAEFASLSGLYAFHVSSAADHATMIRAALKAGAKVDKDISEELYNVTLTFGPVSAMVLAYREQVCERVQVGTETVTRAERDPKAVEAALAEIPETEVTEEVPVYEWQCKPLLASESDPR